MVSISRRQFLVRTATAVAGGWFLATRGRPLRAVGGPKSTAHAVPGQFFSAGPSKIPALPLPETYQPVPATAARVPAGVTAPARLLSRADLTAHWPAVAQSRVVAVRHSGVLTSGIPDPEIVLTMLDAGVATLADVADPLAVWRTLFDPAERVLLKVNCIAAGGPTQPAVAYAVAQRLQDAGLTAENILVFDRTDSELADAGYRINDGDQGLQCHGARGEGSEAALTQAVVRFWQEIDNCDAIVNIPTPKAHGTSGVSASMKNHYGSVNHPASLHGSGCDPAIPELNAQPAVRDKTRLLVAAALMVSPFDWNSPEPENALLLSFDPVALDTVARDVLVRHYQEAGRDAGYLVEGAHYLATAQRLEIGATDPGLIDLHEVVLG